MCIHTMVGQMDGDIPPVCEHAVVKAGGEKSCVDVSRESPLCQCQLLHPGRGLIVPFLMERRRRRRKR